MRSLITRVGRTFVILIFAAAMTAMVAGQGPNAPAREPSTPAAAVDAPQPIAEDARRVLLALQQRDTGLADAAALIQKERDAIAAEWNRTIARVQAAAPAGMELSPQLTYVKKPEPVKAPAGVKEPPK